MLSQCTSAFFALAIALVGMVLSRSGAVADQYGLCASPGAYEPSHVIRGRCGGSSVTRSACEAVVPSDPDCRFSFDDDSRCKVSPQFSKDPDLAACCAASGLGTFQPELTCSSYMYGFAGYLTSDPASCNASAPPPWGPSATNADFTAGFAGIWHCCTDGLSCCASSNLSTCLPLPPSPTPTMAPGSSATQMIASMCSRKENFLPNHETIIECVGLTQTQCNDAHGNPVNTEWHPERSPNVCEFKPTPGVLGQQRTACIDAGGTVENAVTCGHYPSFYFDGITFADCTKPNAILPSVTNAQLMDAFAGDPWGCCGGTPSCCSNSSAGCLANSSTTSSSSSVSVGLIVGIVVGIVVVSFVIVMLLYFLLFRRRDSVNVNELELLPDREPAPGSFTSASVHPVSQLPQ